MNVSGKTLLAVGAGLNFAIAALHLGIIIGGVPAYLYFGAANMAAMVDAGSRVPALLTLLFTLLFIGFGLYALSGAGIIHPLPLATLVLVFIGCIYTFRGLTVVFDIIRLIRGAGYPFRQTVFSAIALAIGLLYLIGTARQLGDLQMRPHDTGR